MAVPRWIGFSKQDTVQSHYRDTAEPKFIPADGHYSVTHSIDLSAAQIAAMPFVPSLLVARGQIVWLAGRLHVHPGTLADISPAFWWEQFSKGLRRRTHARTGFCTHPPARWDIQRQVCLSCEHAMMELPELF